MEHPYLSVGRGLAEWSEEGILPPECVFHIQVILIWLRRRRGKEQLILSLTKAQLSTPQPLVHSAWSLESTLERRFSFSRSGWGLRFCISNKLLGDAQASGPPTTIRVATA